MFAIIYILICATANFIWSWVIWTPDRVVTHRYGTQIGFIGFLIIMIAFVTGGALLFAEKGG